MKKGLIIIVALILIISSLYCNLANKNVFVDKVQVINTKKDNENNMFAFMIQGDDGKYTQSQNNTWPGEGYKLNTDNTKCMDNNGAEVKNGITYNEATNLVTVTSNNTSYCYLYFDKFNPAGKQILDNLPADSGLSASTLGDMRRYQGTSVKNYICINVDGSKCNSGDDDMYRIIGIVEDGDEAGQIKVIKETKYGKSVWMWNEKYFTNSGSDYYCGSEGCPEWPNNDLAKSLNSTFLNSLPTKVQNAIVAKQWYYGDIGWDYGSMTADQMYQIETGQINTQYYDMSGNEITTEKWQKSSTKTKIGLMYLHDYYWQSTITNCYYSSSTSRQCKDNGWMHLAQNGNSTDYEWTMTRIGRYNSVTPTVFAWVVHIYGYVDNNSSHNSYPVRPVFYLSTNVKIKEGGTGEKTNPYILDLS